ncbi:MAG TPA: GNAT family N-acetyltransferase [Gemmatimonadaceae bacterium]|nr:GNAT family N-acetyltransferase [Gemmatimonadaceae bacterium]
MTIRTPDALPALQPRTTPPAIRLRRAGVDDAPWVAALGARLFLQAYDGLMDPGDIAAYLHATFGVAQQARELRERDTAVWVADSDGRGSVGFAMLRRRPLPGDESGRRGIELARIYVDREWQGHRLGATLLATCVSEARAWDGDLLWLRVWQHDARAIAFYQRLGLRIVGEQDFVVGADRQRDWLMALVLR